MSKHQGVNTSSKMDFIPKNPDINQIYPSSKLYLRIQVHFLLLQKIWRNILDAYYRLGCDAMKSGRSLPEFRMNMLPPNIVFYPEDVRPCLESNSYGPAHNHTSLQTLISRPSIEAFYLRF